VLADKESNMNADTRIETLGPIQFVGVAVHGGAESDPVDTAWSLFGEVGRDASISTVGRDIYGLLVFHPDFPERLEWTYMACLEREPNVDVPIRMLTKSLPKCRYVVQKVAGGVVGIDDAIDHVYRDYIPSHGLQVAMPIQIEKYCNVQDPEKVPDDIEVWAPIT
jgi:predicted transcriptional regulator YdeE